MAIYYSETFYDNQYITIIIYNQNISTNTNTENQRGVTKRYAVY
jgi:hypothetical protein